jgi:hypothetical protein
MFEYLLNSTLFMSLERDLLTISSISRAIGRGLSGPT